VNACATEELLLLVSVVIVLARIQEVTEANIVNCYYYYVLSTEFSDFFISPNFSGFLPYGKRIGLTLFRAADKQK
jgi:hypothetical protein